MKNGLCIVVLLIAGAAHAQAVEAVGPEAPLGRFGVGGGASISLLPQVTLHPTVDLWWAKALPDGWGLGARVSTLGRFNTAALSGRRLLVSSETLRLAARLELFAELSMGAGERVEVDPLTTWMKPLVGVAPGLALEVRDTPDRTWSVLLDAPIALPGLTGVTMRGTYGDTTWAQAAVRPGIASDMRLTGDLRFFSSIQLWLSPSVVAPVVSLGLSF